MSEMERRCVVVEELRALKSAEGDEPQVRRIGGSTAGTLRLQEDDRGLAFEIDLPDTGYARDLWRLVDRGDVSQMSFGFRTVTDSWRMEESVPTRTLEAVELFDVSPVTYPAYGETNVDVRSKAEALRTLEVEDVERGSVPVSVLKRRLAVIEAEV